MRGEKGDEGVQVKSLPLYLELHQVDIHVAVGVILAGGVRELRDAVAGHPQPRLDLRQVEHYLPVGSGVERRRFL
ncbi:hypothetical protein EYF80_030421 [Liparis tanakae]|uniref:Uncharacterized protein n=1 Tax=Liparis tanakae TaxID=230148 RepID=A0A4Z2H0X5_9TELE|nr:hypothetical protein EYF80_030421 [Liparis tanakae]